MSAEGKSFLEFTKICVPIRICADFPKTVCRKHNLSVTDSNYSNLSGSHSDNIYSDSCLRFV